MIRLTFCIVCNDVASYSSSHCRMVHRQNSEPVVCLFLDIDKALYSRLVWFYRTTMVDNTDAEGRLILADALCYADTFNPTAVLDMAALTGIIIMEHDSAIDVALGSAVTGVFSNSNTTWELLQKAGSRTGDRVWRMPLLQHYSKQVTESQLADVNNVAFLKEFVTAKQWMHLDIAGVMMNQDEVPYLSKGMSGRPTRTVVEFLKLLSEQS
ncbi:cytosol aminopeptidase [Mytilus galloprovincialis]|uniref:Cytosol aminopeptidase n=1 Tax=Mytilus galloprovincialis TaxID=29158 RepID=A0A8B6C9S7_MYTGA|nr:cytosol aminopeptidase [Mytilus galloprovincialis]